MFCSQKLKHRITVGNCGTKRAPIHANDNRTCTQIIQVSYFNSISILSVWSQYNKKIFQLDFKQYTINIEEIKFCTILLINLECLHIHLI